MPETLAFTWMPRTAVYLVGDPERHLRQWFSEPSFREADFRLMLLPLLDMMIEQLDDDELERRLVALDATRKTARTYLELLAESEIANDEELADLLAQPPDPRTQARRDRLHSLSQVLVWKYDPTPENALDVYRSTAPEHRGLALDFACKCWLDGLMCNSGQGWKW